MQTSTSEAATAILPKESPGSSPASAPVRGSPRGARSSSPSTRVGSTSSTRRAARLFSAKPGSTDSLPSLTLDRACSQPRQDSPLQDQRRGDQRQGDDYRCRHDLPPWLLEARLALEGGDG